MVRLWCIISLKIEIDNTWQILNILIVAMARSETLETVILALMGEDERYMTPMEAIIDGVYYVFTPLFMFLVFSYFLYHYPLYVLTFLVGMIVGLP
jgi:hypothetical protein